MPFLFWNFSSSLLSTSRKNNILLANFFVCFFQYVFTCVGGGIVAVCLLLAYLAHHFLDILYLIP
jgi:hypothetical protein